MIMTIDKMHVGRGESRGALTVFPIWQRRTPGTTVVLATDGALRVQELDSPSVPHLRVTPSGRLPVLLLDGDVLVGGRQDRVAAGSRLLAPGFSATVDVRCVEQERWSGSQTHSVGGRATAFVRGNHDQQEVWRRVAVERSRAPGVPEVSGWEPLPGQSGVLTGIGGRPALLELFADEVLLAAAWQRILAAAARDAAGRPPKQTPGYRAREFAGAVEAMPLSVRPQDSSMAISAGTGGLELRGVAEGHRLLHASVINQKAVAA